MEFRCRLASPSGEITEGVYVADSEARLRRELEERFAQEELVIRAQETERL